MQSSRPGSSTIPVVGLFVLCCFFLVGVVSAQEEETPTEIQEAETMPDEPIPPPTAEALDHPSGPHNPPTEGKFVGDHWTPYEPPDPESFAEGSEIHIIVPGDTLWDLAGQYLESPWLWPQIWDVNRYILDSHWIYPGDPILIPGAPTLIAEVEPVVEEPAEEEVFEEEVFEEPEPEPEPVAPSMPPPPALYPVAEATDVYCSNYIDDDFVEPALFIEEREEGAKTILATGDIVYLSQGSVDGIRAGDLFSVIRPTHDVFHPFMEEEWIGTSVRSHGRLQVIAVQDSASTAEIIDACDAIEIGDFLSPFQEVAVPMSGPVVFRPETIDIIGENGGYIVHVLDDKFSFGSGDIVNIDMGSADGVQPGDRFTVYRGWSGSVRFDSSTTYIDGQQERAEELRGFAGIGSEDAEEGVVQGYRNLVLGQLVILATREGTSTGRIQAAVRELSVGDRVELR